MLATNTYTGATDVNAGQLTVTTRHAGGGSFAVTDGATLTFTVATAGATLGMSSLTLGSGSGPTTNGFNLGALGNPTAPVANAPTLTLTGTVYVNVTGSGLSPGTITLIDYGSIGGSGNLVTNPLPPGVEGYLQTNLAATSIELVVTKVPSLRWTGQTNAVPVGNWDINGTSNWVNLVDLQPAYFLNGLAVEFDDTGLTKTVTLRTNVQPFSITVNNTLAYTLTNAGVATDQIAGTARIIKDGTGILVLGTSNTYSGPTEIKNGTVKLAAAEGIGNGSTVTNDAALDLNGFSETIGGLYGAGQVTNSAAAAVVLGISGAGDFSGQLVDGQGTLAVLKSAGVLRLSGNNTYSGGTTIAAGGTLTARTLQLGADNVLGTGPLTWNGPATLTPDSAAPRLLTNSLVLNAGSAYGSTGAGLLTCSGPISILGSDRTLTFNSDTEFSGPTFDSVSGGFDHKEGPGTLRLKNISCTWTNASALRLDDGAMIIDGATVTLNGGAFRIQSQIENGIATLSISNGGSLNITATGGDLQIGTTSATATSTNIANIQGTVTMGNAVRLGGGGMLAVLNLGGGGVIATDVILSDATNNITEVNLDGGTLQATASRGDFMQGLTNVFVRSGGVTIDTPYAITIAQDLLNGGGGGGLTKTGTGTLQLDGANTYTGTTTVNNGGFGGDGTIAGPVVINSEGTLRPGGGAIGTLTINNNLTLNPGADAVFELNTANSPGTNDAASRVRHLEHHRQLAHGDQ